jgi:hypothetical protein
MCAPVLHVQLLKQREEHVLEHAVRFGAHEHFSFVDMLRINVFVDWQVSSIFFKKTLFPNMESNEHEYPTANE